MSDPIPTQTPNVVISNPSIRFWLGIGLYSLAIVAQLFQIFVADTVVEVTAEPWVDKTTDAISLLAAVFGIAVNTPNVPR
jgi:hypothetical protein